MGIPESDSITAYSVGIIDEQLRAIDHDNDYRNGVDPVGSINPARNYPINSLDN